MAPRTKEQFTVICDGLFLNDAKPANWDENPNTKSFPWEPSVGIHYRLLDENGEPTGDVQKKYKSQMWLWQGMGGKNAKGRYFRIEGEHGEIPGQKGSPPKPYFSIMPIAEVFSDGGARFLEPPKEGKINTPGPSEKQKGPVSPAGPKAPTGAPPPANTPESSVEKKGPPITLPAFADPNTARIANFLKKMTQAQSDEWWTAKSHLNYDGADATNVLDFAKQMALSEIANHNGPETDDIRMAGESCIDYWCGSFRARLLRMKFQNIEERLIHYASLAITVADLNTIINKAWTELPESFFNQVRKAAIARIGEVKKLTDKNGVFTGSVSGTLQPEIKIITPDDIVEEEYRAELESLGDKVQAPQEDRVLIESVVVTIGKFQDFKKLMTYWETTSTKLKAVAEIEQAMRLWIADFYMRAKYQANVDGALEAFPRNLMTPELEKTLADRYSQLAHF